MGYLKNFAKNNRIKEKTEVLTARIPAGLYNDFKSYCDELGLSISEAVFHLVYREMEGFESVQKQELNTDVYKEIHNVVDSNTKPNTPVIKPTTIVDKPKQIRIGTTTERFTTKQWQVDGELPCPLCREWVSASNFARHAKQHGSNTHSIFTNENNLSIVKKMMEDKTNSRV